MFTKPKIYGRVSFFSGNQCLFLSPILSVRLGGGVSLSSLVERRA
jgi:hypothetical protein